MGKFADSRLNPHVEPLEHRLVEATSHCGATVEVEVRSVFENTQRVNQGLLYVLHISGHCLDCPFHLGEFHAQRLLLTLVEVERDSTSGVRIEKGYPLISQ